MGLNKFGTDPLGAIPLSDEDIEGLLIDTVLDRKTLNQVEAENIAKAKIYFLTHKKKYADLDYLLSDDCVKEIHRKMFGEVWSWVGTYRRIDTNIGIPWMEISVRTRNLVLDFRERCHNVMSCVT